MSRSRRPTAMSLIRSAPCRPEQSETPKRKPRLRAPKRLTPIQRQIWQEITATTDFRRCDLFVLETAVCLIDQQRQLQDQVNVDGPIVRQTNGKSMHHPAASAVRQLEAMLTRVFKELGMTPATRARLKLDNRTDSDTGEWSRWDKF